MTATTTYYIVRKQQFRQYCNFEYTLNLYILCNDINYEKKYQFIEFRRFDRRVKKLVHRRAVIKSSEKLRLIKYIVIVLWKIVSASKLPKFYQI